MGTAPFFTMFRAAFALVAGAFVADAQCGVSGNCCVGGNCQYNTCGTYMAQQPMAQMVQPQAYTMIEVDREEEEKKAAAAAKAKKKTKVVYLQPAQPAQQQQYAYQQPQ